MASCLQKIPSGNESRARKENMMKWVFQTLAIDRDWITTRLNNDCKVTALKEQVRVYEMACYTCLRGWCASVGDALVWVAWVVC